MADNIAGKAKKLFSRQRRFHKKAKVHQPPELSHKLGLQLQLQQSARRCRKQPGLPAAGASETPAACKDAGPRQQQEVRPAMPGRQGPSLGLLSIQDNVVNQPPPQNPSCLWIDVTRRPQSISLPQNQSMFTELHLTSCSCQPEILAGRLQFYKENWRKISNNPWFCLLYTSPSPRDATLSRMPSSA